MFHLWTGISLIATALNRRVWFDQVHFKLFPNQYIILVAGSQECMKSTALGIGKRILKGLPPELRPKILSQKITPEAIISTLRPNARASPTGIVLNNSSGMLYADELSVLLTRDARNSGIIALLVNLYDSDDEWSYTTKHGGVEGLDNVYVNLLAGSSPEYLRLTLPYDEIGGGFLARTIFVFQDRAKQKIPFVDEAPQTKGSQTKLIEDLAKIANLSGQIQITEQGRAWYRDWYNSQDSTTYDTTIAPYLHKKKAQVIKLAEVMSVAESDSLVVDEIHLQMALAILEENEKGLPNVMGAVMTSQEGWKNHMVLKAMRDLLFTKGQITKADLTKKLSHDLNSGQIAEVMETLIDSGDVIEHYAKGVTSYELVSERKKPVTSEVTTNG